MKACFQSLSFLLAGLVPASAAFPALSLEMVVDKQIQSPTTITHAGDGSGRIFVGEQRGRIHVLRDDHLLPTPFLDLSAKLVTERTNFDERGLLGLAFHPGFGQAGHPGHRRFYVFYSAPSPNAPGISSQPVDCRSVIEEYRVSATHPDQADPASGRILLSFDKPQFNHNGGQLAFGPDGFLYFGTGDGGGSNDNQAGHTGGSTTRPTNALGNAQDLNSWMGKIHRIDPLGNNAPGGQYGIPSDNPHPSGTRPEIWCHGLRNPWRFCFDSITGRLFCADVGQGNIEEVNLISKGGNHGWRNREGSSVLQLAIDAPPLTGTVIEPIAQYAHPNVTIGNPPLPQYGISITGGVLYRGSAIPAMQGMYLFGDYSLDGNNPSANLLGLEETPSGWTLSKPSIAGGNPIPWFIQTFGEDESGEILVGTKLNRPPSAMVNGYPAGALLRIVTHTPPPPSRRKSWESAHFLTGSYVDPDADPDADGVPNLLEYAWDRHPLSADRSPDALACRSENGSWTVSFDRDPRASDLTYILERSTDLSSWTPALTIGAGLPPAGPPFTGESAVPGHAFLLRVSCSFPENPPGTFMRLRVARP